MELILLIQIVDRSGVFATYLRGPQLNETDDKPMEDVTNL